MPSASSAGDRAGLSSSFWVINIHILPFEAADSMDPLTGLGRVGVSEAGEHGSRRAWPWTQYLLSSTCGDTQPL